VAHLGYNSLNDPPSKSTDYYLPKALAIKKAYCFVGAKAKDTTNGPSGVVCTSEDFKSVFDALCSVKNAPVRFFSSLSLSLYLSFFLFFLLLNSFFFSLLPLLPRRSTSPVPTSRTTPFLFRDLWLTPTITTTPTTTG